MEEVVGTGDYVALVRLRGRGHDALQNVRWAEFVAIAGDEQFGLGATGQELVGVVATCSLNRDSEAEDSGNARIAASGAKPGVGTERETGEENRLGVLTRQIVETGADVVDLAASEVVCTLAATGSAEVEAQDGQAEVAEGLHRMVDNFVMHGSPKKWMRMRDQRNVGCVVGAGIQQGFKTTVGTVEVLKISDMRLKCHTNKVHGIAALPGYAWVILGYGD